MSASLAPSDSFGIENFPKVWVPRKIVPPKGVLIHILDSVPVVLDGDWLEAIKAVDPKADGECEAKRIGDLYEPVGKGLLYLPVVLLNCSWDKSLAWAKVNGLRPTCPRVVFAIGALFPDLKRDLDLLDGECTPSHTLVSATTGYSRVKGDERTCCVVWKKDVYQQSGKGIVRKVGTPKIGDVYFSGDWVTFIPI